MCTSPITMVKLLDHFNKKTGKNIMVSPRKFENLRNDSFRRYGFDCYTHYEVLQVPCRHCMECRLHDSRDWAIRCVLEARDWQHNYFVTLTYDDVHLPFSEPLENYVDYETGAVYNVDPAPTLVPDHVKAFNKSLRRYYDYHFGHQDIRFYMSGEYGSKTFRPHYHYILFNLPINDLTFYKTNFDGMPLYNSKTLSDIWKKGFVVIGDVTLQSAQYVARYVTKKRKGPLSATEYLLRNQVPEFSRVSRQPGIARKYYDVHKHEFYNYDEINEIGISKAKPCSYFDRLYDIEEPEIMAGIKAERKRKAEEAEKAISLRTQLSKKERDAIRERKFKEVEKKLLRPLD